MNEIRNIVERKAALLETGDTTAIMAYYAPSYVEYSLAPPLRQPGNGGDPAPLEKWMATFEAPPRREVTRLEITQDGDVAFATSLDCLSAVPRGAAEGFRLCRVTLGLRRIDGRWLVAHEHESVPFEMDGSLRASVGLTPPGEDQERKVRR
ncbi:nuclear transport factor 2 family protein [Actinoplanes sp. TFC3]|uniref:nuclear transport factor 2 family protein n=1 Tax=Actinoplanes sp. TFC3 TaxID=1710355 RepID=UPI0008300FDA|nr:nuclear transport factor 2 family protein [Actinoplanes sp. TFC3]